jgi:hypothetical protein
VSEPKFPRDPEKPLPDAGDARLPEEEADISGLDDDGIDREEKREAVRAKREERIAVRTAVKRREREHQVLVGVILVGTGVTLLVIFVGLFGNLGFLGCGFAMLWRIMRSVFSQLDPFGK